MSKFLKVIGIIAVLLVIIGAAAYWFILKKFTPEAETPAMYNQERIVKTIEDQLKETDVQKARTKAPLIIEKNITELQQAIADGALTYEELTAFYLDRILQFDQIDNGMNSISEINPQAIKEAKAFDQQASQTPKKPLYGIPVTLKENINTTNMISSAGAYALRTFKPKEDAEVVKKLTEAQTLILGKVNLSELANYMSMKAPSGYSSKHGQTLNPYGPLKITPSGSSSGSAASVTMNIGAFSLGTETMGSIVSPASHQSVVGFKPTHSSVSGEGVLPLAPSLDTVGPIARSVVDVAQGYNAFKKDTVPSIDSTKFTKNNLQGQRIGLLEMPSAEEEFAKRYDLPFKTLEELIAYNQQDKKVRAKYGQDLLEADVKKKQPDKEIIQTTIKKAQQTFDALLKKQQLDGYAFIDSEGTGLSAVAGYPELTVPLAKNSEGQPYGLTFTQTANKEQTLFKQAYSFEQSTKGRIVLSDNELLANSKKINRDEQ
ncbi:amidase [Enterococcus faecalis]|nr:amidase [Enterococcus faecalis]